MGLSEGGEVGIGGSGCGREARTAAMVPLSLFDRFLCASAVQMDDWFELF